MDDERPHFWAVTCTEHFGSAVTPADVTRETVALLLAACHQDDMAWRAVLGNLTCLYCTLGSLAATLTHSWADGEVLERWQERIREHDAGARRLESDVQEHWRPAEELPDEPPAD